MARIVDIQLRFSHCQLVVGDVPTLIDAGTLSDVPRILAAMTRAGLEPSDLRQIILTHADGDHAGGAAHLQELSGAQVTAHRDEADYFAGKLPSGFGLIKRAVIALGGRARHPEVRRWLRGGEVLDGLEIIATPGHTPGHISVLCGKALIAGDAFTTGGRCKEVPRVMSADVPGSREAIRMLAERDVLRAFSGHGPPVDDAGRRLRELSARLR
jgi:glyoxylase-like metal-dependent hydrolase (beta-lactamase superfamily II)